MARRNRPKQLSQVEIEQFMATAEAMHKSIVRPLISPQCDHYRSLQTLHEALLKAVMEITGKDATFIQWSGTGPAKELTPAISLPKEP